MWTEACFRLHGETAMGSRGTAGASALARPHTGTNHPRKHPGTGGCVRGAVTVRMASALSPRAPQKTERVPAAVATRGDSNQCVFQLIWVLFASN